MIPADVASRLQTQVTSDVSLRPSAPVRDVSDRLSDLVAGQRVMAQIQAMLPNGTYRALINQRDVTLALPFSARSGDSLELLVTESDGKKALAVVSHREAQAGQTTRESVSTTLSRTGQFIAQLLGDGKETVDRPSTPLLNGNKPISNAPPQSANDILPALKQAISESGMFYESHQARWVEGQYPKDALLREPQGKLSSPHTTPPSASGQSDAAARANTTPHQPNPGLSTSAEIDTTRSQAREPIQTSDTAARANTAPHQPNPGLSTSANVDTARSLAREPVQTQGTHQLIAPQTQGIVQHQLEALATQHFAWQGQVWPGQEMRWEIEEDGKGRGQDGEEVTERWQTHLNLRLPTLGGVNAQIQLRGEQIVLSISVDKPQTGVLMQRERENLRRQMLDAGLTITSLGIGEEQVSS